MAKRTFIAIAFPAAVREQLQHQCARFQQYLQQHNAPNVLRWVAVEHLHLTLRFLGETTPDQLCRLAAGLDAVTTTHPPFSLTLGGLGGFPSPRQPRVLWLGVGGSLAQLNHLQGQVEVSVRNAGFVAEQRPFSAHVTLARARRNATKAQLNQIGMLLSGYCEIQDQPPSAPLELAVDEIVHMASELRSSGAIYTPIRRFAFA